MLITKVRTVKNMVTVGRKQRVYDIGSRIKYVIMGLHELSTVFAESMGSKLVFSRMLLMRSLKTVMDTSKMTNGRTKSTAPI